MIARIEALNYRCLRYVAQELSPFQVLVGPNGSGKSTFLDVVALLKDFLANGLNDAILLGPEPGRPRGRSSRVEELFFQGQGEHFELGVELEIPEHLRRPKTNGSAERARYEVAFGKVADSGELAVISEALYLRPGRPERKGKKPAARRSSLRLPATLRKAWVNIRDQAGWRRVLKRRPQSSVYHVWSETKGLREGFASRPRRAALASLADDPRRFPVATWVRELLQRDVQRIALNVETLRRPCSPSLPARFLADGSNLPRVARDLRQRDRRRFRNWIADIRTVLPDLKDIVIVANPADGSLYFHVIQGDGPAVPSWLLSDGTLRMLALAILPYLGLKDNVYLIEEPENGVHPGAIEAIYDALSGVYDNQVLLATHSPLLLGCAKLSELLCFSRSEEGAVAVIPGNEHPALRDWRGEVDLPTLYAAGVLS